MKKIFGSPSRYVQGPDMLKQLGSISKTYGEKPAVIVGPTVVNIVRDILEETFKDNQGGYYLEVLGENGPNECCEEAINIFRENANAAGCDMFVGIGGGKTLDVAKASACYESLPLITCPTTAATDAPCSALAVIYTPEGVWTHHMFLKSNPNVVLVDETIIANAPLRFNLAGMPDALSTYYEAVTANAANTDNFLGGKHTVISEAIAQLTYDTIYKYGEQAAAAFKVHAVTPAVEKVIETSTLMSGVGFESNQSAASHAVQNAMTAVASTHKYYHGEKVAFGIMTQLALEAWDDEEIEKFARFCIHLGLPVTFAECGLGNASEEDLIKISELACKEGETIHNSVVPVNPTIVLDAMKTADELGRKYHEIYKKMI